MSKLVTKRLRGPAVKRKNRGIMRFHLALSVLFTAFVTDADTAVLILSGSSAPDRADTQGAGGSARPGRRVSRAGVTS